VLRLYAAALPRASSRKTSIFERLERFEQLVNPRVESRPARPWRFNAGQA
jgi:hypothetical protein